MPTTTYSPFGSTDYQNSALYYNQFMQEQYGSLSAYQSSVDAFWLSKYSVASPEYVHLKQALDKNSVASSQYHFFDSISAVQSRVATALGTNLQNTDKNVLKVADSIVNTGLISIGGPAAKELAKYAAKDGLKGTINSIAKEMGLSGSTAYYFTKTLKDYAKFAAEHANKVAGTFTAALVANDWTHDDYYAMAKHGGGFYVANKAYKYGVSIWDATYAAAKAGQFGSLSEATLSKIYHSPLAKSTFVLSIAAMAVTDFELAVDLVKEARNGNLGDSYGFLADAIGQKAKDMWDDVFENPSKYPQMGESLDPLQAFWNGIYDTATDPSFWLPSWLMPAVGMHGGRGMVNFGSPLILDLDGDGAHSTKLGWGSDRSTVYFDMDNDGFAERTGWVSKTDGLLALDKNSTSKLDTQGALFGNTNTLADGFSNLQ
jgi:hypothetical protein